MNWPFWMGHSPLKGAARWHIWWSKSGRGDRREVFQAAVSSATTPHTLPLFTISEHVQMIKNLRDQFPSMQAKRRKEFIAKIALKRYQTTFQAMPVAVHVAVADDCLRKKVDWRFQVPNGNDMHGRNYCVQQELSGLTCHRCQRKSSNSAFQSPKPKCSIHYRNHQEPVDPHESVPCHHAWSTRCEAQLLLQLEKWESPQIDEIRAARLIMWKNDKSRLALFECQIKDAKESSCDMLRQLPPDLWIALSFAEIFVDLEPGQWDDCWSGKVEVGAF